MSLRRNCYFSLGAVAVGVATWFASPAGASGISAAQAQLLGAAYRGTGHSYTTNNSNVSFTFNAPGSGGSCNDATSGLALGGSCSAQLVGNVAVKNLDTCVGTGAGVFTFTSSAGPSYIFTGTLTMHHRTGTFTGYFTNIGQIELGFAHAHFVMNKLPCGGSQQFPNNANATTFAGTFEDIHE